MKPNWFGTLALALAMAVSGCGVEAGDELSPSEEQAEQAEAIRSRAYEDFLGAWQADEGTLQNVVFTEATLEGGRRFFAERTVMCVRAPCPPVREEGNYRATARYLYLTQDGATERFSYTARGDELTLRQGRRVVHRLRRIPTYCAAVADCSDQSYPVPRCLGYATCESNRCGYRCGTPPASCASNADCSRTQFCASSTCGGAGTCTARPGACITLYNPVCGCDGRTYGNACSAASSGVSVASTGECAPTEPGACMSDAQCSALHFCDRPGCGTRGSCRTGSTVRCTSVYTPVCGCDGETYSNACMALVASASVAYEGACR